MAIDLPQDRDGTEQPGRRLSRWDPSTASSEDSMQVGKLPRHALADSSK